MDWPSDGQLVRRVDRPLACFGVALAQQGDDHLLDQAQLTVHGIAIEAQVPRLDPVGPELRSQVGQGERILVVGGDPRHVDRRDQPEPLESGQLLG